MSGTGQAATEARTGHPADRMQQVDGAVRWRWVTLVAIAVVIGVTTLVAGIVLDQKVSDPEGSFLGPSWVRLPVLCFSAVVVDLLPRALWLGRLHPSRTVAVVRARIREHWTRERVTLVFVGISCFYVTYVCYRNLKSMLPLVRDAAYDRELFLLDRVAFFGTEPSAVLHDVLGTTVAAHVLSFIYLTYIPLVAILVTVWLVWSRNIGFGWWFVTAQAIAWTLGVLSYYALPTLGPGLAYPSLFTDLTPTATGDLVDSLVNARHRFLWADGAYQGVAGFASLHTAISLLWALMAQYTIRSRTVHVIFWANFGLTVLATIYFGWHYLADDLGGIAIAVVAFYLGALATGHRPLPGAGARRATAEQPQPQPDSRPTVPAE
ncbi:phosphatase PAP2 family protein [Nocardioides sp. zg-ZUI104]|uniref:phosphatase PAP2 family protein n=1 Tax=Nocardioides faecalis TaxID=2803858 RepID=UPI001BCD89B4|nr:phosphatase PAP2 family protein [Nocardioides faecalis]MBS4754523.1 phosphatase PAP2 family protein [Nocardioides faecalis]